MHRAVILAAGQGTRLRPLTTTTPKCLVEVRGTPILINALDCLAGVGVTEVTIVIGHRGARIRERLGQAYAGMRLGYVESDAFATTNNLYSLWLAREHLQGDVLLLEGDVMFTPELLARLVAGPQTNLLATSRWTPEMDGTVAHVDAGGRVRRLDTGGADPGATPARGLDLRKTVNICLLRAGFVAEHLRPGLARRVEAGDTGVYYESVFEELIEGEAAEFRAVDCSDLAWAEIDSLVDLRAAELRFAPAAERYEIVRRSHGGYWRFDVADHAYLYNLWFPCPELLARLRRRLGALIQHIPLGHGELTELMATLTGHAPEQLVVGNGASELIKVLGERGDASVVVTVPTFNEYEQVWAEDRIDRVAMLAPDFDLDAGALVERVRETKAGLAVIVSPNNPTGQLVERERLLALARELADLDCGLLVDVSFLAFARDGRRASVADALDAHRNLAVIESLSKIYGIAGLRLGYVASSDRAFIAALRERLPIWSVNSLACAALELLPEYREEFARSCERVRAATRQLEAELGAIAGLEVLPSDANFVLCRLPTPGPTGPEVARALFVEHAILIKHCAGKTMADAERYVRIASRTEPENARLAAALAGLLARGVAA